MRPFAALSVLVFATTLSAQETPTALPANYAVQFENAWVKVTTVHYGPFERVAPHAHTPNPSAYVYLNDGPPVRFRHIGGHNAVATRPLTKAGAFRIYRGLDEIHEVENTGNTPSEFLRVELKTTVRSPDTFRGKFERPALPSADAVVHVDHAQVRISRAWARPGETLTIATQSEPALVIALSAVGDLTPGQVRWISSSSSFSLQNLTANTVDLLRFDFKTQPGSTDR